MIQSIKKFIYGDLFIAFWGLLTFYLWMKDYAHWGLYIYLGALFLIFVLSKDVMPSIVVLFNALFVISKTEWALDDIPLYLYMTPVALISGMVIHMIRFKTPFKGKMSLGIGIMFLAMLLSSFNADLIDMNYVFYGIIGLLYVLIYFFYNNSLSETKLSYFLKTLFALGVLISFQVFYYYLTVDDIVQAIDHKTINLGWGISNYVATYLIIFTTVTFYYARTSKWGLVFLIIGFFEALMLIFTLSRGGIIAFMGTLVLILFYLFYQNKRWPVILGGVVTIALSIYFVVHALPDVFLKLYERFMDRGLDPTGRFEIYKNAWETFKDYPLFGKGLFARLDEAGDYRMYHNTILHTMATFGTIGLIGLLIQLFMMFKIVLSKLSLERIAIVIAMLGMHAHGMVDNIYYMPQFMILLFIIIAVFENINKSDDISTETLLNGGAA